MPKVDIHQLMAEQTLTAQAQYFKWNCWAQRRFHARQNSCLASRSTQSCHHKQKMMILSNSTESQMAGSTQHTQIYAYSQTYTSTSLLTHTHLHTTVYSHAHTQVYKTNVLTHTYMHKHTHTHKLI